MNVIEEIKRFKHLLVLMKNNLPMKSEFGYCASNAQIGYPLRVENPKNVFIYENTKIRDGARIINSPKERVIIKKYSAIAPNATIVTSNHISTVSIPHILLGSSHINDKSTDIIIEEDVWVGTGAILLAGAKLGRGCIVGAGSIINREIPPYALVVGNPAKIVAVKFSVDQIMKHEKSIYAESERFSRDYIEELFANFYQDKRVFGKETVIDSEIEMCLKKIKDRINYVEFSSFL